MRKYVGIHDKLPIAETIPLSLQHLFAMFGATILVPIIFHIDPAIALLMNGIGTLIYTVVTKGGIPAYLGSSFAFIAPTLLIIEKYGGFSHALSGYIVFGILFILVAFVIKYFGVKWIDVVMPPAVMGAVVAVIGLELAPVAAQTAGLLPQPTKVGEVVQAYTPNLQVILVAAVTLLLGVFGSIVFRGFWKVIPILIAVGGGYILALILGMVDTSKISEANWFELPQFTAPVFDMNAIIIILPAFLVVLAEHVGHLIVTSNITGEDLMENPGLSRSLMGNGLATIISGFAGSPPNTTYGENIGVMAITRVYSVWVIRGAALIAIILSCIGKIAAFIQTIPDPVIGGISLLLYGIIAVSGIRMLVEKKVDFSKSYNMVLASVTFIIGISGASINLGPNVQLKGMALAAVTGMILSLFFYLLGKLGLLNEDYQPTIE